ncbi:hypothetical protein [Emticicia sp. BO119]|uniref:hypothetical protein n=1 Tax=Emticicia sp. BO119 TaxID=2757768 RepID=UPI0015F06427|nr:hypothetical protein [Emticicia sp. BO119]MBA4850039.1 hypothetical protein [Emticicia sp. BO119]
MKGSFYLLIFSVVMSSCKKNEDFAACQLEKFIQENPINRSFHYDNITLKNGRIEKLLSFDINVNKDTLNKAIIFFEYNSKGQVKAVRDEANPTRIKRFDASFDNSGNATKIIQTTNGNIEDEIAVQYNAKNLPTEITSRYLLGINRNIEYDNKGNPQLIFRSDLGSTPSITEHTFDEMHNFFSGIPEIKFYWIVRPLNTFVPFGDHNIVSSKVYLFDKTEFKESVSQRTKRELVYNQNGFPETIKIIREDLSSTISNLSTFSYQCR